ncbi:hypothetical protein D1872_231530 [compost metagenome]
MDPRLPSRQRDDRHPAVGDAEIQQFVNVPALLHQHVLADDADVRHPVLHVSRHIHRLRQNKLHADFRQRNHQLARLVHIGRNLNPGLAKQGRRFFIDTPLGHRHFDNFAHLLT